MSRPVDKRSHADQKRANQATMDLYAALAGRPTVQLSPVRPKRDTPANPRTEPTEHESQQAVIQWWAKAHAACGLPKFALYAVPNAAKRDVKLAAYMKSEGLRPGIPDLFLAAMRRQGDRYCGGMYIEMKAHPNKATPEQMEFLQYADKAGYATMICYSAEAAIATIGAYLGGEA